MKDSSPSSCTIFGMRNNQKYFFFAGLLAWQCELTVVEVLICLLRFLTPFRTAWNVASKVDLSLQTPAPQLCVWQRAAGGQAARWVSFPPLPTPRAVPGRIPSV